MSKRVLGKQIVYLWKVVQCLRGVPAFQKYKDHPAVKMFDQEWEVGLWILHQYIQFWNHNFARNRNHGLTQEVSVIFNQMKDVWGCKGINLISGNCRYHAQMRYSYAHNRKEHYKRIGKRTPAAITRIIGNVQRSYPDVVPDYKYTPLAEIRVA